MTNGPSVLSAKCHIMEMLGKGFALTALRVCGHSNFSRKADRFFSDPSPSVPVEHSL